jgi:hypothetical protein
MYNMIIYYYVLIVFSLRRESLKLILVTDLFRGGSVTVKQFKRQSSLGVDACR